MEWEKSERLKINNERSKVEVVCIIVHSLVTRCIYFEKKVSKGQIALYEYGQKQTTEEYIQRVNSQWDLESKPVNREANWCT